MRTIAWCVLMVGLVGCQSGPRWYMRDSRPQGDARFDDQPASEVAPQLGEPLPARPSNEAPTLTVPPQPAQKEQTPYETSSRSRSWFGFPSSGQASRSRSANRATQTARRNPSAAPATKGNSQEDSVKQLMADLEKTKREKAALEAKLFEETAKQTQQRLELEARLALLQEQMRQQSALQQVVYQQQAAAMSRPMPTYSNPVITSGVPSPSMQMPFSPSPQSYAPQSQPQSQAIPMWGNSAPAWNAPSVPPTQQVEQWPFSSQRR